ELAAPQLHGSGEELRREDESAREQLAVEEDPQPVGLAYCREPVEEYVLGMAIRPIGLGQHIGSAALVDVDMGGELGDLGHELDSARSRADNGHALAGQVDIVVPSG